MINEQENNSELLQNENLKTNNNDNSDKKLPLIAKEKLLEAGVQFGHKTQR
jgi:hypothetical protein